MNKKRVIKTIIRADEIEWNYTSSEDKYICDSCGGLIFYIKKMIGVVKEELDFQIVNYKDKICYRLKEYGYKVYCAECGEFQDFEFIDNINLVCTFEDLGSSEKEEIQYCLDQYNQKRKYIPRYETSETKILLKKLEEHEKSRKNK